MRAHAWVYRSVCIRHLSPVSDYLSIDNHLRPEKAFHGDMQLPIYIYISKL